MAVSDFSFTEVTVEEANHSYIVLDTPLLIYSCGFAHEKWGYRNKVTGIKHSRKTMFPKEDYPDLEKIRLSDSGLGAVCSSMENVIASIKKELPGRLISYAVDGKDNYRKKLNLPFEYKGNRDPNVRPLYINESFEYIDNQYEIMSPSTPTKEADDLLGRYANLAIMCTLDKDLLQISGIHYNWKTKSIKRVTALQGYNNLGMQLLMGDKADNIIGIPHVGPIKAKSMIDRIQGDYTFTSESLDLSYGTNYKNFLYYSIMQIYKEHLRKESEKRHSPLEEETLHKLAVHWFMSVLSTVWIEHPTETMVEGVTCDELLVTLYEKEVKPLQE